MTLKRSGFKKPTPEKLKELQERKYVKAVEKKRERTITNKDKLKARKPLRSHTIKSKPLKVVNKGKVPKTTAKLKKELDTLFSIWIRKTHDPICYTCGKTDVALQCGHFVPRQYLATRWHENNCRPQCPGCNIWGGGKPLDFEERLKKELGDEYVEALKQSRHQVLKLDRNWYTEQIAHYKSLI